jgi:hypothetical protein
MQGKQDRLFGFGARLFQLSGGVVPLGTLSYKRVFDRRWRSTSTSRGESLVSSEVVDEGFSFLAGSKKQGGARFTSRTQLWHQAKKSRLRSGVGYIADP